MTDQQRPVIDWASLPDHEAYEELQRLCAHLAAKLSEDMRDVVGRAPSRRWVARSQAEQRIAAASMALGTLLGSIEQAERLLDIRQPSRREAACRYWSQPIARKPDESSVRDGGGLC